MLRDYRVVTCDVVLGELALGAGLAAKVEDDLSLLPALPCPSAAETRAALRRHRAFRAAGIGWADLQILVSAMESGALLYSADRPQCAAWRALGFRLA